MKSGGVLGAWDSAELSREGRLNAGALLCLQLSFRSWPALLTSRVSVMDGEVNGSGSFPTLEQVSNAASKRRQSLPGRCIECTSLSSLLVSVYSVRLLLSCFAGCAYCLKQNQWGMLHGRGPLALLSPLRMYSLCPDIGSDKCGSPWATSDNRLSANRQQNGGKPVPLNRQAAAHGARLSYCRSPSPCCGDHALEDGADTRCTVLRRIQPNSTRGDSAVHTHTRIFPL